MKHNESSGTHSGRQELSVSSRGPGRMLERPVFCTSAEHAGVGEETLRPGVLTTPHTHWKEDVWGGRSLAALLPGRAGRALGAVR